jgi:hypothetical protein
MLHRGPTALVSCVATIVFRLIDTVDNVSLLCFPALLSWFTSACTFAAFIVDLAMFYIAKRMVHPRRLGLAGIRELFLRYQPGRRSTKSKGS